MPFIIGGVAAAVALAGGIALLQPRFVLREVHVANPVAAAADTVVAPSAAPSTHPENTWIEWSSDTGGGPYRIAGLTLAMAVVKVDDIDAPRLTVRPDDGTVTGITGEAAGWTNTAGQFAVVQLRADDPSRQVLFSSFSGGAHCCTALVVLERDGDRWRRIDLGYFDGDGMSLPRDIDGDGVKEFEFVDQRFLYAFTSYAGSWAPPTIRQVVEGRVRDVSAEPRFRSEFAAYLPEARQACAGGSNGACAAFVAAAARTGALESAWAFMLRSYDQMDDWDYPAACRIRTAGACPEGVEQVFATFPEALQWYLGELGYTPPSYVEPLNARGPSFDCGGARTPAERLICGDAALAGLDRRMAAAYTRATALSAARTTLRASQREFLAERNQSLDPAAMAALYSARIKQLAAVG